MMDKKDVLYISVPGEIRAVTLNDLVFDNEAVSIKAYNEMNARSHVTCTFGQDTRYGELKFEEN